MTQKGGGSDLVELAMSPADVKAGVPVNVESYRIIQAQRAGMQYDPVTGGGIGGKLEFTPSRSGQFTRNFIQEGGQLFAEIK